MMAFPALTPGEVLLMRYDWTMELLGSRLRLLNPTRGQERPRRDEGYETRPDGSRVYRIRGMDSLRALLKKGSV